MIYEFEGRTEKEAIDNAAEELGLEKDDFDVEILETQRQGLFKKGHVRIRVHTDKPVSPAYARAEAAANGGTADDGNARKAAPRKDSPSRPVFGDTAALNEFEEKMTAFIEGLIERMGYGGTVSVLFREESKLGLKIDSEHSSILIGKKARSKHFSSRL